MKVLLAFGHNLRLLTGRKGSIARVAEDLGIGRVQFQRFLRAESFPKPNVLAQICAYFGVDARILTEELTPELLHKMQSDGAAAQAPDLTEVQRNWLKATSFAGDDFDYFSGPHSLEDGLYTIWRRSLSQADKVFRSNIQIATHNGVKTLRGYDPKSLYASVNPPASEREYRGFCLKLDWGYSCIIFGSRPRPTSSVFFLAPTGFLGARCSFFGFSCLGREEISGTRRTSRMLMEKVEGTYQQIIRQAHMPMFYDPQDVPKRIMSRIGPPLEQTEGV
jgi:transcriptional regulator with XRE-family HTH domain